MTDYRKNAADTVMRKSLAALQLLTNQQTAVRLGTSGAPGDIEAAPVDEILVAETARALEMARAALKEEADSNEEDGRDG